MVNILIISHSQKIAASINELMNEIKTNDFIFDYLGGIENGEYFGTNPLEIKEKINSLIKTNDLLIICYMGSSVLNCQMAIDFLEPDDQKKVLISNGPFFEGTLNAIISNQSKTSLCDLQKIVNETSCIKY